MNFAENLLHEATNGDADRIALTCLSESRPRYEKTYGELVADVGAFEAWLRSVGVGPGDRVAGVVAHTHEPIAAMLACASLGAIWASASPDFGVPGLVDRFAQIEPSVLVVVDGYVYGGKRFDRGPFDRPVYILFSSGTTGVPKCIVHGADGALLQHAKEIVLHGNVGREDVFFYFTNCGWMMWSWHVSGLVTGARLVTSDGHPGHPDQAGLWAMAARERISHFGTSAKWLAACPNAGLAPGRSQDLAGLRVIFSTGSPLLNADYDWIYDELGQDLLLGSISGGTDIVSSFVGFCPTRPVRRGEIQCRLLGIAAAAFDPDGQSLIDEKGELVCTQPIPSMPVAFWNDPDGKRYRAAYFERFPGIWAHGDFVRFTPSGGP